MSEVVGTYVISLSGGGGDYDARIHSLVPLVLLPLSIPSRPLPSLFFIYYYFHTDQCYPPLTNLCPFFSLSLPPTPHIDTTNISFYFQKLPFVLYL